MNDSSSSERWQESKSCHHYQSDERDIDIFIHLMEKSMVIVSLMKELSRHQCGKGNHLPSS